MKRAYCWKVFEFAILHSQRTRHTAEVVASILNLPFEGPQCKVVEDLLERYLGPSFELMSHDKYAEIRALDGNYPFMQPEGGESVADVVTRLTNALLTIDTEFQGCAVLIVSHGGDPLQILQTILNAAIADDKGSDKNNDLTSRIQAVNSTGSLPWILKNSEQLCRSLLLCMFWQSFF